MQDQYAGLAGTFVNDPETGTRVPIEQYQAAQAAKEQPKAPVKKTSTEESS